MDDRDLFVRSRAALLDALEALEAHRDAVIVIGAQAIYLRVASPQVALAEATKDSDVMVDPRLLQDDPLIERAMGLAKFSPGQNPGEWINHDGIPVDLMVAESLAGPSSRSRRGARIPPHDRRAMRRASGLEAALVDYDLLEVSALDGDPRRYIVKVAGPAALLIAKAHKLGERAETPSRLKDKDAHDVYRILVGTETKDLAATFRRLREEPTSSASAKEAVEYLRALFAGGPESLGAMMAGRAEEGIGEPATVSLAAAILTSDLLALLGD